MGCDRSTLRFWIALTLLTLLYSFFVPHPGIFVILGIISVYTFYLLYKKYK